MARVLQTPDESIFFIVTFFNLQTMINLFLATPISVSSYYVLQGIFIVNSLSAVDK
jgi:hypothetical protein